MIIFTVLREVFAILLKKKLFKFLCFFFNPTDSFGNRVIINNKLDFEYFENDSAKVVFIVKRPPSNLFSNILMMEVGGVHAEKKKIHEKSSNAFEAIKAKMIPELIEIRFVYELSSEKEEKHEKFRDSFEAIKAKAMQKMLYAGIINPKETHENTIKLIKEMEAALMQEWIKTGIMYKSNMKKAIEAAKAGMSVVLASRLYEVPMRIVYDEIRKMENSAHFLKKDSATTSASTSPSLSSQPINEETYAKHPDEFGNKIDDEKIDEGSSSEQVHAKLVEISKGNGGEGKDISLGQANREEPCKNGKEEISKLQTSPSKTGSFNFFRFQNIHQSNAVVLSLFQ